MIKKNLFSLVAIGICFFIVLSITCVNAINLDKNSKEENMTPQKVNGMFNINVHLGDSIHNLYKNNPSMFIGSNELDIKPTSGIGIGFDRPNLTFDEQKDTNLKIFAKNGQELFHIQDVEDVLIISDSNHKDEGITYVDFNIQLRQEDRSIQDVYYIFKRISDQVKGSGWKPFIDFEVPRIIGEESYELKENSKYSVFQDIYYLSSFEKFKEYYEKYNGDFTFYLENNGYYMEISTINGGDFSFNLTLNTTFSEMYYRYKMEEEIRAKEWKAYLKRDLEKWKKERERAELDLKQQGYSIDESYKDPDVWKYLK